jgi:BON domain
MFQRISILLIAAVAAVCSASDLHAQGQGQGFGGAMLGGGGGGGGGGSSFGGGSSSGGFGSTGVGAGSSMSGTNGSGMSMMSAASLSGGFGILGFGAANGFGSGAQSMYGGRVYGSTTSAGGSSTGSGGTNGGSRSMTSSSSTSGGGGGAAGGNTRGRSRTTTNTAAKEQQAWFEPRIEIAFEVQPRPTSAVASNLAASLGASKEGSRFGGVRVAIDGSTAVLRGAVASQNDRQLAEQIALLEPSITSVRNELTIKTRTATSPATR